MFLKDVKLLLEDIGELKPTIFCAVPRVLDRIYSGKLFYPGFAEDLFVCSLCIRSNYKGYLNLDNIISICFWWYSEKRSHPACIFVTSFYLGGAWTVVIVFVSFCMLSQIIFSDKILHVQNMGPGLICQFLTFQCSIVGMLTKRCWNETGRG